jgi:hypothetical protein
VKKKEGLSSFGQKARGVTERRMREVVARPLWQLLWPGEKGSFGWFWERTSMKHRLTYTMFPHSGVFLKSNPLLLGIKNHKRKLWLCMLCGGELLQEPEAVFFFCFL